MPFNFQILFSVQRVSDSYDRKLGLVLKIAVKLVWRIIYVTLLCNFKLGVNI